jgi:hypothetical protein
LIDQSKKMIKQTSIQEAVEVFRRTKVLSFIAHREAADDSVGLVLLKLSPTCCSITDGKRTLLVPRYMLVAFYMFDTWWYGETRATGDNKLEHRATSYEDTQQMSEWCSKPKDVMKQVHSKGLQHYDWCTIFGYYSKVTQAMFRWYYHHQSDGTLVEVSEEDLEWLHDHPVAWSDGGDDDPIIAYAGSVIAYRSPIPIVSGLNRPMSPLMEHKLLPPKKRFNYNYGT